MDYKDCEHITATFNRGSLSNASIIVKIEDGKKVSLYHGCLSVSAKELTPNELHKVHEDLTALIESWGSTDTPIVFNELIEELEQFMDNIAPPIEPKMPLSARIKRFAAKIKAISSGFHIAEMYKNQAV